MHRRVDRGLSVRVVTCALALISASAGRALADDSGSPELVETVKTTKPRADMSAFLVKDAEAAFAKRDWPRAVPMYEALVVARGPASAEARKLADAYALAGRRDDALDVLGRFSSTTEDPAAKKEADDAIDRLKQVNEAFAKPVVLASVDKQANAAFKLGRAAFAKKQYADALVYYTMGYKLAPDLPGFLRELGATYDKLGASDKKVDFYLAYLHRRPFGKNADEVRKSLASNKRVLGAVTITSSLPCDEAWVAGQRVPGKLPVKELSFAPGNYKALCINNKYELGFFEYVTVTAGQTAQLAFNWGIVVNKLENPYGRIAIEEPRSKGVMLDLGVDQPELGVVVPADGHAMRMLLKDDTGTQTKECFVKIAPGQRIVVTWKQC
jgi:tetratricopeptide (TPR) repeat protein